MKLLINEQCSWTVVVLWTGLVVTVTSRDHGSAGDSWTVIKKGQSSDLGRMLKKRDLTVTDSINIVNELNQLRQTAPGANPVSWDAQLEMVVDKWVTQCDLSRQIGVNQTTLEGRNIEGFKGITPGSANIPTELQRIYNGQTNDSVGLCQQLLAPDMLFIGCASHQCTVLSNNIFTKATIFACIYAYQNAYVPPPVGTSYCTAKQFQTTTPLSVNNPNQVELSRMWWILSIAGSSAIFLLISLAISCMVLCRRRFRFRQDQAAATGEGRSIDSEMAVYSTAGGIDHFPPGFVSVMHPPPYLEGVDGDKPPAYSVVILPPDDQPAAAETIQVPAPPPYRAISNSETPGDEPVESENISPPVYDNLAFSHA